MEEEEGEWKEISPGSSVFELQRVHYYSPPLPVLLF